MELSLAAAPSTLAPVLWGAEPLTNSLTVVPVAAGWALVFLGPALAGLALLIVGMRRGAKIGVGAAALITLVWFVVTADWLPPDWSAFWETHSIAAGVIPSVLGAAAAWIFVDERLAIRRLAALHATWHRWLADHHQFMRTLAQEPPTPDVGVLEQRVRAADLRSRLASQQQWTAAMFTITALRADQNHIEHIDLIEKISRLRDVSSDAVQGITRLEVLLNSVDSGYLPAEAIEALWKQPLFHLDRLVHTFESLKDSVRASHWDAQARSGRAPTHDVVDLEHMHVTRVTKLQN